MPIYVSSGVACPSDRGVGPIGRQALNSCLTCSHHAAPYICQLHSSLTISLLQDSVQPWNRPSKQNTLASKATTNTLSKVIEALLRTSKKPSPELESTGAITLRFTPYVYAVHTRDCSCVAGTPRYFNIMHGAPQHFEDVQKINTLLNGHGLIDSSGIPI